jgi:hypothetical protein
MLLKHTQKFLCKFNGQIQIKRKFVIPSTNTQNLQLVVDLRGTKAILPPREKKGVQLIISLSTSNTLGGPQEQPYSRDPSHPQSPEAIALVLALLPSDWRSVHPGIMGEMLASKIKCDNNLFGHFSLLYFECLLASFNNSHFVDLDRVAEGTDSSDIVKPIVSDLVEYLATQDLTYTGHILYYFLTKFGRMFLELSASILMSSHFCLPAHAWRVDCVRDDLCAVAASQARRMEEVWSHGFGGILSKIKIDCPYLYFRLNLCPILARPILCNYSLSCPQCP